MKRFVLAGLLTLVASIADAGLPQPPFELTLSQTSVEEGQPITIGIAPKRQPGTNGEARYDIYVLVASIEEAAFLAPNGTWAPRPVAYVAAMSTADPPVARKWSKAWPPGRHALGMVVVPTSNDPLARAGWRYRPVITSLDIVPSSTRDGVPAFATLALLGTVTTAAVVAVWWFGVGAHAPSRGDRLVTTARSQDLPSGRT